MIDPIYKFLPPSRDSYIEDGKLRFSQPRSLNDPFELVNFNVLKGYEQHLISSFQSELQRIEKISDPSIREIERQGVQSAIDEELACVGRKGSKELTKFTQDIIDKFGKKLGVLSLSDRWNSSLMWSHYAQRHTGFCVGFDRSHPFFADETLQKTKLRPVVYGLARIDFEEEIQGLGPRIPFYKSPEWAYEEESRITFYWERNGPINFTELKAENPPGTPVRLLHVPHESICELLIGMETPADLKEKIIKFAARLRVPVFETFQSVTKLTLERGELIL
ncbi:DUF2971 domain-containing protein [Prosthecobacter vanneervenii]|uniref:DUF2971 domain-containing protein n=1 Tax=Prosthecobacter vanneervenii TaxID=48466 RepID=A0A7W7YAG0_9BACT|nr:DUF2971 domain-containing protein [Prosthecobacter vanneervenii]MBB5032602.1 hypothetical protein [Prosthecobacter vanneervenii]